MIRFKKSGNKILLIYISDLIRKICGGDRIKRISKTVINISQKISKKHKKKIFILDFGCGSMEVSKKLQKKKFVKGIIGTDIFEYSYENKNMKYIETKKLFKSNPKKFDIIIAIDVLHHMGVHNSHKILEKLSKISNYILIKDHFEYGFFSRHLLRFVDFYANYAYDVVIPDRYFNKKLWLNTVKKASLKETLRIENFQQHDGVFNLILNKRHHFISLLKNEKK